jgi:hypothetical protein
MSPTPVRERLRASDQLPADRLIELVITFGVILCPLLALAMIFL